MAKVAGHILKGHNAKFEGQFHLDMAQTEQGTSKGKRAVSARPQVRILESHPEFAVVEITCSCGVKTSLKCEYDAVESSVNQSGPRSQVQNGAVVNPDRISDRTK